MTAAKRRYPGPDTAPYRGGTLLDYVDRNAVRAQTTMTAGQGSAYDVPDTWAPNLPFHGTLVLTGMERGRSAARFMWAGTGDLTGRIYPMFMTDACNLMMSGAGVANGTASRWWIVVKRGRNYGLMPLPDDLIALALKESVIAA